jgi:hypothetical protein
MMRNHRVTAGALLACTILFGGCADHPVVEKVPISSFKDYRSPAQSYDLSERERVVCQRKALAGDIMAAKKLATYHMMVTRDQKKVHYWLKVVAQLQKARKEDKESQSLR